MNAGSSSYSLKSQKLTITISPSGMRKNSTNTNVNGAACHQAGTVRFGLSATGPAVAVDVLLMEIPVRGKSRKPFRREMS
ncbi:hypothetical protein FQZ97_844050 [compost metagenome]